jgi:hypothetical protein
MWGKNIMLHEIGYSIDNRVIYVRFDGDLTTDDALASNVATIELIRGGIAPVHYIVDTRHLKNVRVNLKQMTEVATFLREPNLGWVIVIGGSPIARFLSSVIMQMKHQNFHFAESLEDAHASLTRVDTSLKEAAH